MRLLCCVFLLLAWPAARPTLAPVAPALAVVDHQLHADGGLDLLLRCADPTLAQAGFTLLGEGGAALPAPAVTPAALPLGVALLVDSGPAMELAGTPYSTRRRDALLLAGLLLDRLPADSRVALVSTGSAPAPQLAAAGRADAYPALRALADAAPAAAPPTGTARSAAIALGAAQLADAPPGPRHLIIFTADTAGWARALATAPPGADLSLTLFDLAGSAEPGPEAALGNAAALIPYHTDSSPDLPELLTAATDHITAMVAQRAHLHLQLPAGALPAGTRRVIVGGCGGSATLTLDPPDQAGWRWPGALGAAALGMAGAGLVAWRRGRPQAPGTRRAALPPPAGPRPLTSPYRAAADLPTDRHGQIATTRYRLAVSGPGGQSTHELTAGQWAIGRDPACAVAIDNAWLSALHARLSVAADRIELTDLDSTNGTAVGPARRRLAPDAPEPLEIGEAFWLGPEIHAVVEAADDDQ